MIQLSPFLSLMLCLLTFEISEDQDGKNFYTRGPWYTFLVIKDFLTFCNVQSLQIILDT